MNTVYLLFQIFVAIAASETFMPPGDVDTTVYDINKRIGTTGDRRHKLGFVVGPISFNQDDDAVRKLVTHSFELARKKNMAVAFHIDAHMFWDRRADLYQNKDNIEWIDFNGTPCTHRKLDWGPEPSAAPAQMCLNSPAILQAVRNRGRLIGTQIKNELDRLKSEGREELFAGVICGWESRIGEDFATNTSTGYHALSNAGLGAKNSSAQCDLVLTKTVKNFIETWAESMSKCGVPPSKLYCHIAFTSQGLGTSETSDSEGKRAVSYARRVGFAVPSVAFSSFYRPGFSTYPMDDSIEQIRSVVVKNGNPPWISAEGTNVVPNGMPGEPTMESYLAKMYNHGAVAVNIFSWGIGGEAQRQNMFRRATESDEAISAYRKFLRGDKLQEKRRPANQFSAVRLQNKIHTIQASLPAWLSKTHRPDLVQPLMTQLDKAIKGNQFTEADRLADELLKILGKSGQHMWPD